MRVALTRTMLGWALTLLSIVSPIRQNRRAMSEPLAANVFKKVQVLKGLTANEFMETMVIFSASTLLNCTDCYTKESAGNWKNYANYTSTKIRHAEWSR